jgi:ADP-ribosylglycohydrolase
MSKFDAYYATNLSVREFLKDNSIEVDDVFDKLFSDEINTLSESEIESSGYVIHTLEASVWILLNTDSYKNSILQAVNLGEDTDTTATVVGGMTGLLYGYDNIPSEWIESLKRSDDIKKLSNDITKALINLYL